MRQILLGLLCCLAFSLTAQTNYNLQLLANVPFPGEQGNDCWGYADSLGREYAIMGTIAATYIYSLEEPTAPVLRARIPGATSIWRDIKTFGKYIYVVADQGADGLLVIDMTQAPATITHEFYKPTVTIGTSSTVLDRAHNLYISQEGLMVLAGTNIYSGAPLFFDLRVSRKQPPFVGASRQVYAHDVYAERNRLYSSDINAGVLTIHDYSVPSAIRALGSVQTTNTFTHNAWPKANDQFVFTTDEVAGAFVDAFDAADPTAIRRLDRFRPDATFNSGSVPHNTHVNGDYLATSWYRDGVILTDALRPHNLIQVGQYDTYPQATGSGFDGCWGAYPFLPSGRLLASDINTGLYIFEPNYQRGCYFEGVVIDSITRAFLGNVRVNFDDRPAQEDFSDANGEFATGIYEEGTYPVTFSRSGYLPKQVSAVMERGVLNFQIIELSAIKPNLFTINAVTPAGVPIPAPEIETTFLTRVSGRNSYNILVGKWGYVTRLLSDTSFVEGTPVTLTVVLQPGYQDEFILDLGWTTTSTAVAGNWERGEPEATTLNSTIAQLGEDVDDDLGELCYATGLAAGNGVGANDVDGGVVTLLSPLFDLRSDSNAIIGFDYHFFNGGGASPPNDTLVVTLSNGADTLVLLRTGSNTQTWTEFRSTPLAGRIAFTDNMQLQVVTADEPTSGHLVEAMFDNFKVISANQPALAVSEDFGCAPFTTTFTVTSLVDNPEFFFNNFDSSGISGNSVTRTFTAPGSYTVFLVTGPADMRDTFRYDDAVRVDPAPVAAFAQAALDLSVSFTNQSTDATSFVWDFGDGITSQERNPVHGYASSGSYQVTLTARAACGNDTTSRSVTVMTSGTREFVEATGLEVLGNPAASTLQLRYSGTSEIDVLLRDALGRVVLTQKLATPGLHDLDVRGLNAGNYFLTVAQAPAQGQLIQVLR